MAKKTTEVMEEVVEEVGKLNEIKVHYSVRKNGTLRVQRDFSNCPTLAEQHTAHLTDINYLIKKYKPDELAAYIAARSAHRQEIVGHDFAAEPNLQDAKNIVLKSRKEFEELPDEVRFQFRNHLEFLKFVDNPANSEKLVKLGLITKKKLDAIKIPDNEISPPIKAPEKTLADDQKPK